MTITEFDNTGWSGGMTAEYKGEIYPIISCDFDEKLIALVGVCGGYDPDEENWTWVRCENVSAVHRPNAADLPAMPSLALKILSALNRSNADVEASGPSPTSETLKPQ